MTEPVDESRADFRALTQRIWAAVVRYKGMVAVMLVFGFLVIPAVAGLMASPRAGVALAVGWAFGFVCSVIGLLASVQWDMPAAPSILVTLTVVLAVHGALLAAVRFSRRGAAAQ